MQKKKKKKPARIQMYIENKMYKMTTIKELTKKLKKNMSNVLHC